MTFLQFCSVILRNTETHWSPGPMGPECPVKCGRQTCGLLCSVPVTSGNRWCSIEGVALLGHCYLVVIPWVARRDCQTAANWPYPTQHLARCGLRADSSPALSFNAALWRTHCRSFVGRLLADDAARGLGPARGCVSRASRSDEDRRRPSPLATC